MFVLLGCVLGYVVYLIVSFSFFYSASSSTLEFLSIVCIVGGGIIGFKTTHKAGGGINLLGGSTFHGAKELGNDAYKLHLIKKYKIEKNEVLGKYVLANKLYEELELALNVAHEKELSKKNSNDAPRIEKGIAKVIESDFVKKNLRYLILGGIPLILLMAFHSDLIEQFNIYQYESKLKSQLPNSGCYSIKELEGALAEVNGDCNKLKREKEKAKSGGFAYIYEMNEAAKHGVTTKSEWEIVENSLRLKEKYMNSKNSLENALVILNSTDEDLQRHKDSGGLDVSNEWRGYEMQSLTAQYSSEKLISFQAVISTKYMNMSPKPASMSSIKSDLSTECGYEWRLLGSDGDAYVSDTSYSSCEISKSSRGGYHIAVFSKRKKY